jgi:DNA-binding cell septation regulator SpoVG
MVSLETSLKLVNVYLICQELVITGLMVISAMDLYIKRRSKRKSDKLWKDVIVYRDFSSCIP